MELTSDNIGPMAGIASELLTAKGIHCPSMNRFPKRVSEADFQSADMIIALDAEEHRPLMRARFPKWENKIDYWLVHDLDKWDADTALATIESHVNHLVRELRRV